ncbi:ATP cone domain [Legionella steigerwaltii]|uniref:ATP cone domain n=1 Tax=Legionella steigerwaltii TaxID=460 RepID=A0A378LBM8_9GAMM|nr:ATP cone domain-containing protein [Legionella steigerwaltii]KTD80117.1 ATP cone domain protein [Legionella steigerwaltii]STY23139.1 ATP cone domain [Legionella steigerwaltii]
MNKIITPTNHINIIKSSGEKVPFNPRRIYRSLKRVGADESLINKIVHEVSQSVVDGMTTHEIYRIAFRLLRNQSKALAGKYHLKRAIMQLGFSGYPFEKYIAELMRHQGFKVLNNQIIKGYCVNHEVDVVGERQNEHVFVECKYHNRLGLACDVKVTLYFKARFLDIEQAYTKKPEEALQGWLVTNTRFTNDAIQYGQCSGLHLISWDFPQKGNLKELIEFSGLYPITCITNLTKAETETLLGENILLCKTIAENPALLNKLNIGAARMKQIILQCQALYKSRKYEN